MTVSSLRDKVMASALVLFSQKGYHGTSYQDIAAHAAVDVATVYSCFLDKKDLVNEVFREAKRTLADILVDSVDESGVPRQQFLDFWQGMTRFACDYPVHFAFLELQHHYPFLDEESRAVEFQVLAPVWSFCVSYQQQGVLSKDVEPEILMAMIWGSFVGLVKAGRQGYFLLERERIEQAGLQAWALLGAVD